MSPRALMPALLGLLVACNGGDPKDTSPVDDTGDDTGGDSDTGEDSDTSDTGETGDTGGDPDLVLVTVYDPSTGEPDANEAVLFFGPDGTFLVEVATDADGNASASMPDGGAVVVMVRNDDDGLPYWPVASLGVRPGARVTNRSLPPYNGERSDLSWPEEEEAESFRYSSACGDALSGFGYTTAASAPSTLPQCEAASVIVAAMGPDSVLGVVGAPMVDTTSAVALAGPWVVPTPVELAATGLDASTEEVMLEAWHAMGAARVPGGTYGTGVASAGRFQLSGEMAQMEGLSYQLWVGQWREGFLGTTSFLRRPASADLSVDVSGLAMGWLTDPTLDPATGTVSWTQEGSGKVDAMLAIPYLQRGEDTFGWTVGVAPESTSITLPVLPEPWTDYNPQAGDLVAGEYWIYRGEGLGEQAVRDPAALLDRGYLSRGVEIMSDYTLAFSRTFLP